MKESEMEDLLRIEHELEIPRPGLERRIQASLPSGKKSPAVFLTAVLACLAVGIGVFVLQQGRTERVGPIVVEKEEAKPIRVVINNPLEAEAVALEATAKKTANFLLARFPSLPEENS